MSTNILVVDDSPIARKMLVRALPADWDVNVEQVGGGREAIEAYRRGGVDVMFLDLTMPDIDGYQVLETLQKEDMNCLVVVVSADIQPEAEARVKRLGAIAFVKKPVDASKLSTVLKEYGVVL